jgi:ligand-binding sensor domain-containing protein
VRKFARRPGTILAVGAALAAAAVLAVGLRLRATVERALAPAADSARPLRFVRVGPAGPPLAHWGSPSVEGIALTPAGLVVAGGSGVALVRGSETVDLTHGLPGLAVATLSEWRGDTVVGLKSGGLFRRRDGGWEEARSGWGPLEVRALRETEAGELLIGARQGLFRAAWAAPSLERLDTHPVRSIAVDRHAILAGGEEGLVRIDAGRAVAITTPDPWIDDIAVVGGRAYAVTPSGLLQTDSARDGPFTPVAAGADVVAGVALDGAFRALDGMGSRIVRAFTAGRVREDVLPFPARRLLASDGVLFADTTDGLYRRDADGWRIAAPRRAALPPGPAHVTALARLGSDLVAGLFDGGLVTAQAAGGGLRWSDVPGSAAWGVNALLPAGGALYVASLRGAARFDGRRLTPIEGPGAAFSLAATADGVAIGYGQGVLLPGTRLLSAFHGLPGNQAVALLSDDMLFVGTPSGLGAIGDRRVRFRVAGGEGRLPHPWVTALALSRGGLYVGTYGGGIVRRTASGVEAAVARVDGARYEPFVETEGLKINTGCLVEAEGRLYAGTDGKGLYRISADGRAFEPVAAALPSRRITALLAVPGALYVGTDEGVARLALDGAPATETK